MFEVLFRSFCFILSSKCYLLVVYLFIIVISDPIRKDVDEIGRDKGSNCKSPNS